MKTASEEHFDKIASRYDPGKKKYSYYYENLKKLLASLIPPDKNVYEIGCGTGDLLATLKPKIGYGVDVSSEMIKIAKLKYGSSKNLHFFTDYPSTIIHQPSFDFIFMSDVIEHLDNPKEIFRKVRNIMDGKTVFTVGQQTMFICTMANPIWEPLLMIWEKLGLKMREGPHKRIAFEDLRTLIKESGMEIVKHNYKLLIPVKIPLITNFANRYLEKYFKRLAFIEYFVAVKA